MAKKRAARRGGGREDDSDDDVSSTTSTTASSEWAGNQEVEEEYDEGTVLEGYIDALYEKRASTREAGLKGLIGAMTARVLFDFVEEKRETLLQQFLGSVKRGGAAEASLAARALGLLAITAGAGDVAEQILSEASAPLTRLAKSASASAVRIAAMEAIGMLSFVGTPEHGATEEAMTLMWQIAGHKGSQNSSQKLGASVPSPQVRAAALAAWSLLLSCAPSSQVAGYPGSREVKTLASLLGDADLAVRTAAGEAIAVLHEAHAEAFADAFSDSDAGGPSDDDGLPAVPEEAGVVDEEVVEQMRALSVQSTKRRSKKERLSQRTSFREILASIESGTVPTVSMKLMHGDSLHISTWSQTVQFNALRRFLAEGFQRHMQDNELLHQIFGFEPRASKAEGFRNVAEKRMYQSPNSVFSKARTQMRNYSRSQADAENLGHYSVHGED